MLINVKMLNGENFQIEITEEITIGDLKLQLVEKCGWPPEDQKLIYLGRVLRDEQTCASANVQDGTALHLVHKPRPVDPPDHPMDEAPDDGHGHAHGHEHVHLFDTGANSFSFNAIPTHVDPIRRLQTLTRVAERLETQRLSSLESAFANREDVDNLEIFQQEPWDAHMHESSCDEEDHVPPGVFPSPTPVQSRRSMGNDAIEPEPPRSSRLYRDVMLQALGLAERILPFADILSQAAVSHKEFTPTGARAYQAGFDSLNVALHELAHLFHGLSDIIVDFQKPPHQRALTIAPRLDVEHRALLQTAFTIPMTSIGAPRIGEALAQHLGQQIPGLGQVPIVAMGGLGPFSPNPTPDQPPANLAHARDAAPAAAAPNNANDVPANDGGAQADPLRAMSQIIADHVSAIMVQDTNIPRRGHGADVPEASDLTRVLPCSSRLNRVYATSTPALAPHSVGYFESQFVSPMQFANDMLSFAAHPLALRLLKYIHGDLERPEQAQAIERLLAGRIARSLIYKDGFSVVSRMKYAPDGVNFQSPTRDLLMRFQEKIIMCLRNIKTRLSSGPYTARDFGLMEVFQEIAPTLMQDLKCFFCGNRWEGRSYIRCLLDDVFPYKSYSSKKMLEDELLKCFDKADSTQSKYHSKVKVISILPLSNFDPEDIDRERFPDL